MYIPLLTHQIDLNLALSHQSLVYSMARTAYSQTLYSVSYVLIIFFSALACSRKDIQLFGGLILASFLISTTWFLYAFVSIWCYFAGILSLFIAYLITANKQ
jgi:hypothetical protein